MSFIHLHCRSYFSLKDGAYSPEDLALRAAELGMPAVALTDRDGLYGAVRFTDACHQVGVKPILGAWLTLTPGVSLVGPSARLRSNVLDPALAGPARDSTDAPRPPREIAVRGSPTHRVLLLARDARGYATLCWLITSAHMRGERGEPWLSPREVMARSEGLVCLLGPEPAVKRSAM